MEQPKDRWSVAQLLDSEWLRVHQVTEASKGIQSCRKWLETETFLGKHSQSAKATSKSSSKTKIKTKTKGRHTRETKEDPEEEEEEEEEEEIEEDIEEQED